MQDATSGSPSGPLPTTPAGWYPLGGELRYWDGYRWTEHRAAPPTVATSWSTPSRQPVLPRPGHTYLVTDARVSGATVAIIWVIAVLTVGYMLPWAVAATRGKSNSGAIALLNFLLGWTAIGWIIALVMACGSHQVLAVRD
jgi:hypothetical protein